MLARTCNIRRPTCYMRQTRIDNNLPGGCVCRAQRRDTRFPEYFVQGGLCVRQIGVIVEHRRFVLTHYRIDLVLHLGHHIRIVEHVHHGPQNRVLDGLHAGREQVAEDLLHLPVRVQALEQLVHGAGFLRAFDLQQIGVDQVPNGIRIERAPVLLDDVLKVLGDLLMVVLDFFLYIPFVRDVTSRQKQTHRPQHAEQLETFVDHVHVPLETRVVRFESDTHRQRTNHVGDGETQRTGI